MKELYSLLAVTVHTVYLIGLLFLIGSAYLNYGFLVAIFVMVLGVSGGYPFLKAILPLEL